jgi:hypothetical protein
VLHLVGPATMLAAMAAGPDLPRAVAPSPRAGGSGGPVRVEAPAPPERVGYAPTSKRAKRATSTFSPSTAWTSLIRSATVLESSITKGWLSSTYSS